MRSASSPVQSVRTRQGRALVSVSSQGHPLAIYSRLDGRLFVAGTPGQPYVIEVHNQLGSRIEAIVSVDGRNVLKDEPAHPSSSQGLVIAAGARYSFRGWRDGDEETLAFEFGQPETSVAEMAGDRSSIGVIGIAIYAEQVRIMDLAPSYPVGAAAAGYEFSAGVTKGAEKGLSPALGTGIGARQHDPVGRTSFRRAPGETDIIEIGYDTRDNLIAQGIIRPADPSPWPALREEGYGRYAAPLS